jgi:hypothetical protein
MRNIKEEQDEDFALFVFILCLIVFIVVNV